MNIRKLDSTRLPKISKKDIPMEFMSNLREGNKDVKDLIPEIKNIDKKIGEFCEFIYKRFTKTR